MKRWLIAVVVVVVIAVGVGAFFGGKATGGGTPSPTEALKVLTNLTAAQRQQLLGSGGGTRPASSAAAGGPAALAGPAPAVSPVAAS